jgi:hypothetical protein
MLTGLAVIVVLRNVESERSILVSCEETTVSEPLPLDDPDGSVGHQDVLCEPVEGLSRDDPVYSMRDSPRDAVHRPRMDTACGEYRKVNDMWTIPLRRIWERSRIGQIWQCPDFHRTVYRPACNGSVQRVPGLFNTIRSCRAYDRRIVTTHQRAHVPSVPSQTVTPQDRHEACALIRLSHRVVRTQVGLSGRKIPAHDIPYPH